MDETEHLRLLVRARATTIFKTPQVIAYLAVLTLAFIYPLIRLMTYAAGSDLQSHIVLVPFVAGYLLYERRYSLGSGRARSTAVAMPIAAAGLAALAAAFVWRGSLSVNDQLALTAFAYVALLAAGGCWFKGRDWMRAAAFPFAFLLFLVPLPDGAVDWLERASVVGSTDATEIYYRIFGTTYLRQGVVFELPTITLRVAQECSGIRSSWVLFITSVLAANMFLRTTWRRIALVAFVIPLGLLRNGFRIFVLSELCIRIGPHMIDSAIHHRGGPIFFALSLIPLFGLLWWLRRGESASPSPAA
jgi:exosortase C (VPDSG-CTERM-specific)